MFTWPMTVVLYFVSRVFCDQGKIGRSTHTRIRISRTAFLGVSLSLGGRAQAQGKGDKPGHFLGAIPFLGIWYLSAVAFLFSFFAVALSFVFSSRMKGYIVTARNVNNEQ